MHFLKVLNDHQICTDSSTDSGTPNTTLSSVTDQDGTGTRFYDFLRGVWIRDRSGGSAFDEKVFRYKWGTGERSSGGGGRGGAVAHQSTGGGGSSSSSVSIRDDENDKTEKSLNKLFVTRTIDQKTVMSLSKEDYSRCQSKQTNLIVGESHQRFTWSFLAYHYHEGQAAYLKTLERKHGDVSFYRFNLTQKYLIPNIARYLDNYECPKCSNNINSSSNSNSSNSSNSSNNGISINNNNDTNGNNGNNGNSYGVASDDGSNRVAIAVQMGSWDLSAAPLRYSNMRTCVCVCVCVCVSVSVCVCVCVYI